MQAESRVTMKPSRPVGLYSQTARFVELASRCDWLLPLESSQLAAKQRKGGSKLTLLKVQFGLWATLLRL